MPPDEIVPTESLSANVKDIPMNNAMAAFLAKIEAKKPVQKVIESEPEFTESVIDYDYDGGA